MIVLCFVCVCRCVGVPGSVSLCLRMHKFIHHSCHILYSLSVYTNISTVLSCVSFFTVFFFLYIYLFRIPDFIHALHFFVCISCHSNPRFLSCNPSFIMFFPSYFNFRLISRLCLLLVLFFSFSYIPFSSNTFPISSLHYIVFVIMFFFFLLQLSSYFLFLSFYSFLFFSFFLFYFHLPLTHFLFHLFILLYPSSMMQLTTSLFKYPTFYNTTSCLFIYPILLTALLL